MLLRSDFLSFRTDLTQGLGLSLEFQFLVLPQYNDNLVVVFWDFCLLYFESFNFDYSIRKVKKKKKKRNIDKTY